MQLAEGQKRGDVKKGMHPTTPSARQHNQGFFSTYFLDFDLLSAVSESGSRV
jgi:hypothetical protein